MWLCISLLQGGDGLLESNAERNYEQMEAARKRLLELIHYLKHKVEYKKRTEIALELVRQIEQEGNLHQTLDTSQNT